MYYDNYASDINNTICEATCCSARATTKISVRVGDLGNISLSLCSNCITRFVDEDMHLPCAEDARLTKDSTNFGDDRNVSR
jgi:hypothetical protein